jgi:chaperonin cofactor prefoldin
MEQEEYLKARIKALEVELEKVRTQAKNLKMQLSYCQQQNFKK